LLDNRPVRHVSPKNEVEIVRRRTPGLTRDPDGGLTLYLQAESPGKDKEANWLPARVSPDGSDCWPDLLIEGMFFPGYIQRGLSNGAKAVNLLLILIVLILLFGGGGFYIGAPYHYFGGGVSFLLLIVVLILLFRR
jgi:hypothetical protein